MASPFPPQKAIPVHGPFLSFLLFDLFLSFGPDWGPWRWVIGLSGLGLTFLLDRRSPLPAPVTGPFSAPLWTWGTVLLSALILRFYRLTSLSVWPCYDDSLWGWFALAFHETPGWPLFFQGANFPSAHLWGSDLVFEWFGPSLFSLWAYPAFLSFLTVGVGYGAARQFLPPFPSFLALLLLAFGFWPLFVGRFADQMVSVLLWECAYLGLLGAYLKKGGRSRTGAFWMGAASLSGLYVFISCGPVALGGALALMLLWSRQKPFDPGKPVLFLGGALLLGLPLLLGGLGDSLSAYAHVGAWHAPGFDLSLPLSYLTTLFWGTDPAQGPYRPVWGGLLDPVLVSFVFLGVGALRSRSLSLRLGIVLALVLSLLPGMMTNSLEPFRVLPALAPLTVLGALGWERWVLAFRGKGAVLALALSALALAGLDQYHLQGAYGKFSQGPEGWRAYSKSPERSRAFEKLRDLSREKGAGLVFTNFVPGLTDMSLPLLDHPFNAVENPSLDPDQAQWGAVLANANYRPFLDRRFPQGKAYYLSQGLDRPDGGLMLWAFPIRGSQRPSLRGWIAASKALGYRPHWDPQYQLPELLKVRSAFEGDPFLWSSYWEKVSDLIFRSSNFQDLRATQEALAQAFPQGDPAAHLFWRKAVLEEIQGDLAAARRDYARARRCSLDLTRASQDLERLKAVGP